MWPLKETLLQHSMMAFAVLTDLVISLRTNQSDTFMEKKILTDTNLVPRRSRRSQSWTLPWAVTSPRDTPPLFPRLRADNRSRENA